jgi:hypothetical protein
MQYQMRRTLLGIPFYDTPDNRILAYHSVAKCEEYIALGAAYAVRSRKGEIKRLYRIPRQRAIFPVRSAASQTTQRVRNDFGVIISPPHSREHRKIEKEGVRGGAA